MDAGSIFVLCPPTLAARFVLARAVGETCRLRRKKRSRSLSRGLNYKAIGWAVYSCSDRLIDPRIERRSSHRDFPEACCIHRQTLEARRQTPQAVWCFIRPFERVRLIKEKRLP